MCEHSEKILKITSEVIRTTLYTCILLGLISCTTTKNTKEEKVKAGEYIQFVPESAKVNIQCVGGRYPQIFTPESFAEWFISPSNGMVVIKVTLESNFPDMSIAYDSVRLRNFDIHLLLNENTQFQPVQITINKELDETQEGTIRRLKRDIELLFPILASQIMVPKEGLDNLSVNLLIRGYETTFCFSWKPKPAEVEVPISMRVKDSKKHISDKIKRTHQHVLNWTHTFD